MGDVSDRLAAAVVDVEAGETDEGALLQLGLAHADVDGGDAVGGSGVWREEEAEGEAVRVGGGGERGGGEGAGVVDGGLDNDTLGGGAASGDDLEAVRGTDDARA